MRRFVSPAATTSVARRATAVAAAVTSSTAAPVARGVAPIVLPVPVLADNASSLLNTNAVSQHMQQLAAATTARKSATFKSFAPISSVMHAHADDVSDFNGLGAVVSAVPSSATASFAVDASVAISVNSADFAPSRGPSMLRATSPVLAPSQAALSPPTQQQTH